MSHVPGLYRVRLHVVCVYLLVDDDGCTLIDTGLAGEVRAIGRTLRRLGRPWADVKAILLTHGHLDHTAGLHKSKQLSSARVYAHPDEQIHVDGRYAYAGVNRVCGWLEAAGRTLLRYKPVAIDQSIHDGQLLPLWGGLRVIHLPGHTRGHCGFYSEQHDLLFAGDLFESCCCCTRPSPAVFNSTPKDLPGSFRRVVALNPAQILPSHCDTADGRLIRRRFGRMIAKRRFV